MTSYIIEPSRRNIHGRLWSEIEPVLRIRSGDSVVFRTLEGDWRWNKPEHPSTMSGERFLERSFPEDQGHPLCGPVYVEGAKPGMTLKVHVHSVTPLNWGWSRVGGGDSGHLERIGFEGEEHFLLWDLDVKQRICKSNSGIMVPMEPFMGVMAVAPAGGQPHRTHLPGIHGGNLDCRELIAGTTLYMPVYTEGALFSTGDGHARQGDGELGCTAIECPMESVHMSFEVLDEAFEMLVADTPRGWITFGFNEDLTNASYEAFLNMVKLIVRLYGCSHKEAMNLCGAVVDMHVTQIVNGIRGAHAILPHSVIFR